MEGEMIVKSFEQINRNFIETVAANHDIVKALKKQARKLRGTKLAVFGLALTCGVILAELMERKRSENYLQEQIDDLKEMQGKICDRCCENEIKIINLADDFYSSCEASEDRTEADNGGDCDA